MLDSAQVLLLLLYRNRAVLMGTDVIREGSNRRRPWKVRLIWIADRSRASEEGHSK